MNNDSRLPTKEQIQKAEKLLSERKKWLEEFFIPQLQEKFPEFQKSYIQSNVVAITEEDLEDYEEGEEIYNTPLTEFEITLGKIIDLPGNQDNNTASGPPIQLLVSTTPQTFKICLHYVFFDEIEVSAVS